MRKKRVQPAATWLQTEQAHLLLVLTEEICYAVCTEGLEYFAIWIIGENYSPEFQIGAPNLSIRAVERPDPRSTKAVRPKVVISL